MDNIYKKLNKARVELQNMGLKKSGKNTYSNFTYYELQDILPAINILCEKHGLTTLGPNISTYNGVEEANTTLINTDDPEQLINFTIPTAEARIGVKKDGTGGADPIQNLGGKITYLRRYILMIIFEIVEHDTVDAQPPKETKEEVKTLGKEQIEAINATQTVEELKEVSSKLIKEFGSESVIPYYKKRGKELTNGS